MVVAHREAEGVRHTDTGLLESSGTVVRLLDRAGGVVAHQR